MFAPYALAAKSGSSYPADLQEVKMPLVSDAECEDDPDIDSVGGITEELMLCAGYTGGYITTCSVGVMCF